MDTLLQDLYKRDTSKTDISIIKCLQINQINDRVPKKNIGPSFLKRFGLSVRFLNQKEVLSDKNTAQNLGYISSTNEIPVGERLN